MASLMGKQGEVLARIQNRLASMLTVRPLIRRCVHRVIKQTPGEGERWPVSVQTWIHLNLGKHTVAGHLKVHWPVTTGSPKLAKSCREN